MDVDDVRCFTPDHREHDPKWFCVVRNHGHEEEVVCVACVVQVLENSEELRVKQRHVLGQLVHVLQDNKQQFVQVLLVDSRAAAHLTLIMLDLTLDDDDEEFAGLAAEVLYSVLMCLEDEEILGCVVDHISEQALKLCNYRKCVIMFTLLGKLLHNVPLLSAYILQNNAGLLDQVFAGVAYPDPDVQTSLSYICVQLYRSTQPDEKIPLKLSEQLFSHVLQLLSTAAPKENLTVNLLGLLKNMLEVPEILVMMGKAGSSTRHTNSKQPQMSYSLATAIKRVLLSRVDVIQAAGVQCVVTLLTPPAGLADIPPGHVQNLLKQDIAEFLFEALNTTNTLLIGLIFHCLLLFTKCDMFFLKCHAVYGVESVVRSVEQVQKVKNMELQASGIQLLSCILSNDCGKIRLFTGITLLHKCLAVLIEAVGSTSHKVALAATHCFQQLLRSDHQCSPPPYTGYMSVVHRIVERVNEQPTMTCHPPSHVRHQRSARNTLPHPIDGRRGVRNGRKSIGQQQQKCARTQVWLVSLLDTVNRAFQLLSEIGEDPVEDQRSYTQPVSTGCLATIKQSGVGGGDDGHLKVSSVREFTALLLQVAEKTCVPTALENTPYITDPHLLSSLYHTLTYVLTLTTGHQATVAKATTSLGFIEHALQAKTAFGTEELKASADTFLLKLLEVLVLKKSDQQQWNAVAIKKALLHIEGGVSSVVQILKDTCSDGVEDRCYLTATCVSLLYYSVKHCPRSLSDVQLYSPLCNAIGYLHSSKLLQHTTSQLIFLYAWSKQNTQLGNSEMCDSVDDLLAELIQKCKHPYDWCDSSLELVDWCFSSQHLTVNFGESLLEYLLCENSDETIYQHIQNVVTCNVNLIKSLLIMVTSVQSEELRTCVSHLLQDLLSPQRWSVVTVEVQLFLQSYLPEVTHRECLHHSSEPNVKSLCVLLGLMYQLKLLTLEAPLTSLDSKLVLQVCSMIVSDPIIFKTLCNSGAHSRAELDSSEVYTLAMVLNQLNCFQLQVNCSPVTLNVDKYVGALLLRGQSSLTTALLLFWIAYLDISIKDLNDGCNKPDDLLTQTAQDEMTQIESENIAINKSESDMKLAVVIRWGKTNRGQSQAQVKGVGDERIRTLYIYLLQLVLQDQPMICRLATLCLDKLLTFAKADKHIYGQLVSEKWMCLVVSTVFSTHSLLHEPESTSVLTFSALLLKHSVKYISPYLDEIIECLLNTQTAALDPNVKLSYEYCYEQLTNNSIAPLDTEVKAQLQLLQSIVMNSGDAWREFKDFSDFVFVQSAKCYYTSLCS